MRLRTFVAACAVMLALAGESRAVIVGIAATPASPAIGQTVVVRLVDDGQPGPPVMSYSWAYQFACPLGATATIPLVGGDTTTLALGKPGNYTFVVTVTYPFGMRPPATFTAAVSVGAINGKRVASGYYEETPFGMAVSATWILTSNGATVGAMVEGDAEVEYWRSIWLLAPQDDTPWERTGAVTMVQGKIVDVWSFAMGTFWWSQIANYSELGSTVEDYRIHWMFSAANNQTVHAYQYPGNSLRIRIMKEGGMSWEVQLL